MEPKITRWNRNYTKSAEYYYKWEIEVMKKPERIYDIELMMKPIELPKLKFYKPVFEKSFGN